MPVIWKYGIPCDDRFMLSLPLGARVLCVQSQSGVPCLWAVVDPERPTQMRHFSLVATGEPRPGSELNRYIGTFQLPDDTLVYHLFEDRHETLERESSA